MSEWQIMRWDETTLMQVLSKKPIPSPCPKGKGEEPTSDKVLRTAIGSPIEQSSLPVKGREMGWLDYMPTYVKQAYEARKFAFVSDYVRLWALEQYGGVYVDTDVKVLKSYEPLLSDIAFIGFEESKAHLPGTCVMGCEPHCQWVRDMLEVYNGVEFVKSDGSLDLTTNVQRMGASMIRELENEGVREGKWWKDIQYIDKWGLRIYTHDYFSPITSTRVMRKTKNTYSIHYFAESWRDGKRASGWRNWTITREIINALVQIKRKLRGRNV